MGGVEEFWEFLQIIIDSLVFFSKLLYNLNALGFGFVVLKETGQNIVVLWTHGYLLVVHCELVQYKNDNYAFFIVYDVTP